jgi:methylated-DNA-[protein]-cysteine S-methyltransferase
MKPIKTVGKSPSPQSYTIVQSPVDDLMLVTDGTALTGLYFMGREHIPAARTDWKLDPQRPLLQDTAKQLREYFAGTRKRFSVPVRFHGTEFQRKVWEEIAAIPYGETISYSELARRAGAPQAIRAAGTSTGRNPVSIIVPCHRVMGKNGDICGFGGGLDRKRYLLGLENSKVTAGMTNQKRELPGIA